MRSGGHTGPNNRGSLKQEACGRSSNRAKVRSLLVSKAGGCTSAGEPASSRGQHPQLSVPCGQEGGQGSVCAECPEVWRQTVTGQQVLSLDLASACRLLAPRPSRTPAGPLVLSHPGRTHPELTLAALAHQPMPPTLPGHDLENEGSRRL